MEQKQDTIADQRQHYPCSTQHVRLWTQPNTGSAVQHESCREGGKEGHAGKSIFLTPANHMPCHQQCFIFRERCVGKEKKKKKERFSLCRYQDLGHQPGKLPAARLTVSRLPWIVSMGDLDLKAAVHWTYGVYTVISTWNDAISYTLPSPTRLEVKWCLPLVPHLDSEIFFMI